MSSLADEEKYLMDFYNLLKNNLQREKSLKSKSILISFLETRSASRYMLLNNSTIPSNLIPNDILLALTTKKQIQVLDGIGSYAITAQGVWDYEKNLGIMSDIYLLSYINEKFFSGKYSMLSSKNKLDEKEAVILFAMIAARAFSKKSSVNLRKDDVTKSKWQDVLERSYDMLSSLDKIKKLKKEKFLEKAGNEHIVSYIFRHNNSCLQKTRGIYSYHMNNEYYLDLNSDKNISQEKLSYLFWKIFEGNITSEVVDLIIDFCKEISNKESIYLFDMSDHSFSMPIYDSVIRDCLLDSVFSKDKWSKIN